MIYCFDTFYTENSANTACIGILDWENNKPDFEFSEIINDIEDYESGSFYKRELPCITSVLEKINLNPKEDIIVVDGFVVLDDEGKLGLGGYLYEYLDRNIPVIGVAKNNFAKLNQLKRAVYRGESQKPLYVTTKGIDIELAAEKLEKMHGEYRFPTILKIVDQKSREAFAV